MNFFTIIPEKTSKIVQRFGKFHRRLDSGLHFFIPFVDRIAYVHSLKEDAINIDKQLAITKDNVSVSIDGTLFLKIVDPVKASYEVENPQSSLQYLAQTVMRSEIGKLNLDQLFQERKQLNIAIHDGVHNASISWGIQCLRYELLTIDPPESIKESMHSVVEAERIRRREVIDSEAKQQATINVQESYKLAAIMEGTGRAQAIRIRAQKQKQAIQMLSRAIKAIGQNKVQDYLLMTDYIKIMEDILKDSKVTVIGSDLDQNLATVMAAAKILVGQKQQKDKKVQSEEKMEKKVEYLAKNKANVQTEREEKEEKSPKNKDNFGRFQDGPELYNQQAIN